MKTAILSVVAACTLFSLIGCNNRTEVEVLQPTRAAELKPMQQSWRGILPCADCEGIEKKDKKGKKRTEVYYCHPYCSAERGSNENQNRMIRRHIPKGTNFDRKTKKDIQKVEDWLNNYPRPMFGGRSSQELYEEEMRLII